MSLYIIDGYNVIHHWQALKKIVKKDLYAARQELINIIQHFCDFSENEAIIVFDGKDGMEDALLYHDATGRLKVLFSRKKECADALIGRLVYEHKNKKELIIATNDRAIKNLIFGMGAFDLSCEGFKELVKLHVNEKQCPILKSPK